MGNKLEKYKNSNIDKIKIGSCLELTFLFDNIEKDISRLKEFISLNEKYLNNQSVYTLNKNLEDIQSILDNHIEEKDEVPEKVLETFKKLKKIRKNQKSRIFKKM